MQPDLAIGGAKPEIERGLEAALDSGEAAALSRSVVAMCQASASVGSERVASIAFGVIASFRTESSVAALLDSLSMSSDRKAWKLLVGLHTVVSEAPAFSANSELLCQIESAMELCLTDYSSFKSLDLEVLCNPRHEEALSCVCEICLGDEAVASSVRNEWIERFVKEIVTRSEVSKQVRELVSRSILCRWGSIVDEGHHIFVEIPGSESDASLEAYIDASGPYGKMLAICVGKSIRSWTAERIHRDILAPCCYTDDDLVKSGVLGLGIGVRSSEMPKLAKALAFLILDFKLPTGSCWDIFDALGSEADEKLSEALRMSLIERASTGISYTIPSNALPDMADVLEIIDDEKFEGDVSARILEACVGAAHSKIDECDDAESREFWRREVFVGLERAINLYVENPVDPSGYDQLLSLVDEKFDWRSYADLLLRIENKAFLQVLSTRLLQDLSKRSRSWYESLCGDSALSGSSPELSMLNSLSPELGGYMLSELKAEVDRWRPEPWFWGGELKRRSLAWQKFALSSLAQSVLTNQEWNELLEHAEVYSKGSKSALRYARN